MRILVLHNNFPAQFKHLLPLLVQKGHNVIFISKESHGSKIKGLRHFVVKSSKSASAKKNATISGVSKKIDISELFRAAFVQLKDSGFYPDLIIFHSGWAWASTCELFSRQVSWPHLPNGGFRGLHLKVFLTHPSLIIPTHLSKHPWQSVI